MLFNSLQFVAFFGIVLLLYYIIPRKIRWIWLLITSYIFYMAWNVKYVALLASVTVVTYLCGLAIDNIRRREPEKAKRLWSRFFLLAAIIFNIGLLFYYKYVNFLADIIYKICSHLGIQIENVHWDILLPVGISFISIQSLGYVIDVYRGEHAEKNLFKYALFVAFFPQLVAGPIERSANLLKQIQNTHNQKRMSYERFTNGLVLMLYGYFQKVFIADRISPLVNTVFSSPSSYNSLVLIIGAIAFTLQIYCDFGGYSNIAIGAAQVLGFDMMENFNAPYFAIGIKDFWRRWHISLSTWLRDYVYIPLGGNQKGTLRKYVNLMITFLISGLWHGASMHYVVWGGIHGLYQVIGDAAGRFLSGHEIKIKTKAYSFVLLQRIATFSLVSIAFVFFRAASFKTGLAYVIGMFGVPDVRLLFDRTLFSIGVAQNEVYVLLLGIFILFLCDRVRVNMNMRIDQYLSTQNLWFKWLVLWVLIFCIVVFGQYGLYYSASEFIYFQF